MSEYAPSLHLFITAIAALIICIYFRVTQKQYINQNPNFKIPLYFGIILTLIVSLWGITFLIMSWF